MENNKLIVEEHYAREAMRILKEYQEILNSLDLIQKDVDNCKDSLMNYQTDLEDLKLKSQPEKFKEQELHRIMIKYDKEINKMQENMQPHLLKLEDLKKSSHTLYGIFKERWPQSTDDELKQALSIAIQKIEEN